ncbi:MAG: DNA-directed RNA polymerase subunit beta [Chloroflexi bacterium]|nr:DNA-directed RNA polymerase subunit beta [Chloroflexota bacterium]
MPKRSYERFLDRSLRELFDEISPIEDFTGTRMALSFIDYYIESPKLDERECRQRDATYGAPLKVIAELTVKETGEVKEQELYLGDLPLMTEQGTFIINGAERVVVSQLVRSPGVYFTETVDPATGRRLTQAKLIPNRGAWLEFETSNKDIVSVKVDRKRKIPVTILLRAIDIEEDVADEELGTNDRIRRMLGAVDTDEEHSYVDATLAKDPTEDRRAALEEFYRRIRPGDPPTAENARNLLDTLFFGERRYDLGRVGRYKVNKRLSFDDDPAERTLRSEDIITIVRKMIEINNHVGDPDDIDHLGNRRVRSVGELIQNQFRVGLLRMERVVRERMTITDPDEATPSALVNVRPVVAAMKEFFGGSQLSQFMDQTNPLAELAHKRRLSALGPGGLSRDRAGFDVRDVHFSHYGRICPIETPEGPNIGLIGNLATYGRINDFGFIETPYRPVRREVGKASPELVGRVLTADVANSRGRAIASAGDEIDEKLAKKLEKAADDRLAVRPFASRETQYLDADTEKDYRIAEASVRLDDLGNLIDDRLEVRHAERLRMVTSSEVDYIDVSPKQIVSVAAALIPFLEHDDANRALMGANMQRQAVPLLRPEVPLVGTGMERQVAENSGQVLAAEEDGEVLSSSANFITIRYNSGREERYPLSKFVRSNQGTCISQRPLVAKGDTVVAGQPLVDSSSTQNGELALGQSVLVAFMSWEGLNFEDAIVLSESVIRDDKFTSIHIEKYEVEARDTKLGPEEITRDIPNVGDESLRDLDPRGIIRVGAEVREGDILVGKITPKGETELTPEEKLLRAIFGEKAREVKDTSLRVPHGERGKVIDVRVFERTADDELPTDVNMMVRVSVAQKRKIAEGDKMAGRHGNKGVVSRITPIEDMPYLADGRPIEIVLNPIGVPSRMNVGQVLETHLGWAANTLGMRAVTPVFDGASDAEIEDALARAWLAMQAEAVLPEGAPANGHGNGADGSADLGARLDFEALEAYVREGGFDPDQVLSHEHVGAARRACLTLWLEQRGARDVRDLDDTAIDERVSEVARDLGEAPPVWGKQTLYDGRTGEGFDQPVTVGYIYMLKLVHLVEDKIHARSTGPYSLITQQPLGGKAQFGGQRFGEMEVWALEAYGAAHILQEMLTVKSDDVVGRVKAYEAIVKGENTMEPGVPESFKVLVKELQSLCMSVEILNEDEEQVAFSEDYIEAIPSLGINLSGREAEESTSA